jgi:hypothetical protein
MKLASVITILALILAMPSFADVTFHQTMSGKALGFSKATTGTTWIKGNKMRSDAVIGKRTQTTIFDLDAQKLYTFDSRKKQADVWDMAAFAADLSKTVDMSGAQASFRPTGQTKQIAGYSATGYDLEITTQAGMEAGPEMTMTVTLAGPLWVVPEAPGAGDYTRFYSAAVEKGCAAVIFSASSQPSIVIVQTQPDRKMCKLGRNQTTIPTRLTDHQ